MSVRKQRTGEKAAASAATTTGRAKKPRAKRAAAATVAAWPLLKEGRFSPSVERNLERRKALRELASRLESGDPLSKTDRAVAAEIIKRDLWLEFFYRANGLDFETMMKKARTRHAENNSILERVLEVLGDGDPETFFAAVQLVESTWPPEQDERGSLIVPMVNLFRAHGLSKTAAQRQTARILGKVESNVRSQYHRTTAGGT